ncbi:MAG: acyl--CoA ligase [Proteobacteria bacterium]|nr:acyl--CoA ligase [Pseudomonadota bacterium]
MTTTVIEVLREGTPSDAALLTPGRSMLTHGDLVALAERTVEGLNQRGIGRGDRVAIVLPNGPEMAAAFLSVASGATTAPLNPGYREDEFDFYLSDLNAKALIVEQGSTSPALAVAAAKNIPVLEINWKESDPAGYFEFVDDAGTGAAVSQGGFAEPDDIALVLHTSGTTSRPKIVPLSQTNVTASAAHIGKSLRLVPEDRCLNIMPLFHIHGLIAAVLSSMKAGGSVFCAPGFNALSFFSWLEEAKPTWYTAVPTMHQTILARAGRNEGIIAGANLRFVRSSSASLPPQVMAELEEVFGCPVLEAYGMTEAAHQMASNPLPDAPRLPGSVGIAAGPEVSIMDTNGGEMERGDTGEIVIKGPNVFAGYENNPDANAEAFYGDWFRTGDQGVMDADGYIRITGRLKEIINRGGEKISPREVDEVLLDHPAVAQVVTFGVTHDKLGEDVAAAIVLKEGIEATEKEVREFAAKHLADFKVPRKIVILDEIPKGATGKMQRIGLAEKLGLQ